VDSLDAPHRARGPRVRDRLLPGDPSRPDPDRWPFKDTLPAGLEWLNAGNSVIVDPDGALLAGPLAEREDILYAEIDPGRATGSRWIFDAAGHYNRPDLFELRVLGGDGAKPRRKAAATRSGAKRRPSPGPAKPAKRAVARAPKRRAKR